MVGVLRAVLRGAAVGVALGTLARVLMRLVALTTESEPEFNAGASIAIVSLFTISGAGAALAARLRRWAWLSALVVVVTSLPVVVMGTAIGIGEVAESLDQGLGVLRSVAVVVIAAAILLLAYGTPYAGWRTGRPAPVQALLA